ncbi:hypothetical protein BGX26_010460 [Mortierella sp. AD094]|nr:hypothetical protein BGX26_010460 [Mortierella sp. AD094]
MLGLDANSLGLPYESTVFSYWMPSFNEWAQRLSTGAVGTEIPGASSPGLDQFAQMVLPLAGQALSQFTSLPIFSLAPLQPPAVINPNMPYYFGGGGRLLVSLENFPRDTAISALVTGYFVAFAIGDLIIGAMHYQEFVDPLSGYTHHLVYSALAYNMSRVKTLSFFSTLGGALECTTIFLAAGYMFPRLRNDFIFGLSFLLYRILFTLFSWHELILNVQPTGGGAAVFTLALVLHCFWFRKFIAIQLRKKSTVVKEPTSEKLHEL